jgi:hypothetical protein
MAYTCCRDRSCPACRNQDALELAGGCFGALVLFTVCPVTVLLVMGASGIGGNVAGWGMATFLMMSPTITYIAARLWPSRSAP